MTLCKSITFLFVIFSLLGNVEASERVHVAVASNFIQPAKAIIQEFEKTTSNHVVLSSGSSGKIFAQIKHGAPFNVFLSADQAKPNALVEQGLAIGESQFTYALGELYLATSSVDKSGSLVSELTSGHFKRLAIANPKLAPYGRAALQTIDALALSYDVNTKLVTGENIAQTFQFVASGNAQMGFIAGSQIASSNSSAGEVNFQVWKVPTDLYEPIRQDAVLLKDSDKNDAARSFMSFLQSSAARKIITSFGYNEFNQVEHE